MLPSHLISSYLSPPDFLLKFCRHLICVSCVLHASPIAYSLTIWWRREVIFPLRPLCLWKRDFRYLFNKKSSGPCIRHGIVEDRTPAHPENHFSDSCTGYLLKQEETQSVNEAFKYNVTWFAVSSFQLNSCRHIVQLMSDLALKRLL